MKITHTNRYERTLGHILSMMNVLFQPGYNSWELGRKMLKRKHLAPFFSKPSGKVLPKNSYSSKTWLINII